MSWDWYGALTDAFKRRAGRYLINRYLGAFLEDGGVLLEQLTVAGDLCLRDVALNIAEINALLEDLELPVEFVDGYIGRLTVSVPWSDLMRDNCNFSVEGLTVTMQVRERDHPAQISASIFHSMCESFSSFSMAEECLKEEKEEEEKREQEEEHKVRGVELVASAIDSIFMRVKVTLRDTTFRLEYVPSCSGGLGVSGGGGGGRGLALELKVGKIIYAGELGQQQDPAKGASSMGSSTVKKVFFEDVSLFTDDFAFSRRVVDDPLASMMRSRWGEDNREEAEQRQQEEDEKPPLQVAALTGRQELSVKFQELNQFGLPRSIEEVEVGLGGLALHVYPHQVHALVQIMSAVTVPRRDDDGQDSPRPGRKEGKRVNLERLLQQSLVAATPQQSLVSAASAASAGWSGMDHSSEFHPVSSDGSGIRKRPEFALGPKEAAPAPAAAAVPRIVLKLVTVAAALLERDEGVARMGGEDDKASAMRTMRAAAHTFFAEKLAAARGDDRLQQLHRHLRDRVRMSHVAVAACVVTLAHEEGRRADCPLMTSVTVRQLSVAEVLFSPGEAMTTVPLLAFEEDPEKRTQSLDVKLVYRELKEEDEGGVLKNQLDVRLNKCAVDFEPGLVDRLYLLLNYAEMNPDDALVPINESSKAPVSREARTEVTLACAHLTLDLHVPKVDLRYPADVPRFVEVFWSRRVHPELFQFVLKDLAVSVAVAPTPSDPLEVSVSSSDIEAFFREEEAAERLSLVKIRKSAANSTSAAKSAGSVRVSVCLDESRKLQGKFSSEASNNSSRKATAAATAVNPDFSSGSYFVSDSGNVTGTSDSSSNLFLQQLAHIQRALLHGRSHNNLLVSVHLDQVSLVLPSKHVYEVVYNRLGNDLALWTPEILRVKEFLYHRPLPDPLRDPDTGFSDCFSSDNRVASEEARSAIKGPPHIKSYVSFPRDSTAALSLHTDTCVVLSANRVQAAVTTSAFGGEEEEPDRILVATVDKLELGCVVGLEKAPQIVLFNLRLGGGEVRFGHVAAADNRDLSAMHFHANPGGGRLDPLVRPTAYRGRAWPEAAPSSYLLKLTAKVLFDAEANLKTISLAFAFRDASLTLDGATLAAPPAWADWLADFFTVVEYPVDGYVPPAILTEMQFDLRRCSVDVAPLAHPAGLALTLGRAKVGCNLLDTGLEVGIVVKLEDVGLFLTKDRRDDPVDAAVCVADVDYLDLEVHLKEEEEEEEEAALLDVTVSCNRLRVRTCADTIMLLSDLAKAMAAGSPSSSASARNSREASAEPVLAAAETDNVVPDLAAAMEELIANEEKESKRKNRGHVPSAAGAQVFFFPDEGQRAKASSSSSLMPADLGMTESFYPQRELSDDMTLAEEEDFCILDDEMGTGIMPKSGRPTSRSLQQQQQDEVLVFRANVHEAPASRSIDHLRAPASFPRFQSRVTVSRFSVQWHIFGGNDFSPSRALPVNTHRLLQPVAAAAASPRVIRQRQELEEASSNSLSASPARTRADELKTRGGPGRNPDQQLVVLLSKIQFTHEVYPARCREASRQVLVVPAVEVHDRLATSQIKKLLHLYASRARPRQSNSNMLSLRCLHLRPPGDHAADGHAAANADDQVETNVSVSMQPIRLNIDQDTLFFLVDFAGTLFPKGDASAAAGGQLGRPAVSYGQVVGYNRDADAVDVIAGEELAEEAYEDAKSTLGPLTPPPVAAAAAPVEFAEAPAATGRKRPDSGNKTKPDIYIRSFVFSPDVPIRIDYSAKYVDLSQGALAGLLAGLTSLNCSELTLKSVCYQQGVLGLDRLLTLLVTEWTTDIRANQVPRLLGGVGPMYSVLQLFQGIKDLILLPLEQYQKDGRLLRGLQKGANSFTTSTAMSFLDFTNKLLGVIKFAAELAFDIMSPEGVVVQGKLPAPYYSAGRRPAAHQGKPADIREGVYNALAVVREGLDETARVLTEAAAAETARGRGFGGAVGGVLRQVPSTLMRPVILATEATTNVIEGVQGQVAPELRREEEDKWRGAADC